MRNSLAAAGMPVHDESSSVVRDRPTRRGEDEKEGVLALGLMVVTWVCVSVDGERERAERGESEGYAKGEYVRGESSETGSAQVGNRGSGGADRQVKHGRRVEKGRRVEDKQSKGDADATLCALLTFTPCGINDVIIDVGRISQ